MFTTFPNTSKFVKNSSLCVEYLTPLWNFVWKCGQTHSLMFDISCDGLSDLKLDDGFHVLHGPTSVLSKTIRIIKKYINY